MTNNEKLHALVKKNKLGRRDVARLAGYPIAKSGQSAAVNNWLAHPGKSNFRAMPDHALGALELRLKLLTDKERAALEGPTDKVAIIARNRLKRECEQKGYQYVDGTVRKAQGKIKLRA